MAGTAEFDSVSLQERFAAMGRRFEAIEAQLETLSRAAGVPYERPGAGVPSEVVELARAGKTLEAIGKYRELTGAGLEDAKAAVNSI